MSGKNQFPFTYSWFVTNPQTTFLPQRANQTAYPTSEGTSPATVSGTNTLWSEIVDISRIDNAGLEFVWTGTPTGVLSVLVSNSGVNFLPLTTPTITQPSGSAGGTPINLNQIPFRFIQLEYVNASGSGTIAVYAQHKDLN